MLIADVTWLLLRMERDCASEASRSNLRFETCENKFYAVEYSQLPRLARDAHSRAAFATFVSQLLASGTPSLP